MPANQSGLLKSVQKTQNQLHKQLKKQLKRKQQRLFRQSRSNLATISANAKSFSTLSRRKRILPKAAPVEKRINLLLDDKNLKESKIGELVYKLKEPIKNANLYKVGLADTNLQTTLLEVILLEVKFSPKPVIENLNELTANALNTLQTFASIDQYDDESQDSALKDIRQVFDNIKTLIPFMLTIRRSDIELALERISQGIPKARKILENFRRLPVYTENIIVKEKAESNKEKREDLQRIYDEWIKYNFLVTDVVNGFRLSLPPFYEENIKIESIKSDVLDVDSLTYIVTHEDYIVNLAKEIKIK